MAAAPAAASRDMVPVAFSSLGHRPLLEKAQVTHPLKAVAPGAQRTAAHRGRPHGSAHFAISVAAGGIAGAAAGGGRRGRRQRRLVHVARRQLSEGSSGVEVQEKPARLHKSGGRPKVVVLGSGWGAVSFIQALSEEEANMYDITVVSPRNHFLYTPLLPTCAMGSIEERSIVAPIRRIVAKKADFLEARCESIDAVKKVIRCGRAGNPSQRNLTDYERFPQGEAEGKLMFDLEYDILVYSVGAEPNDFNCPGVKEHAFYFKEVEHARKVRNKISDLFEKASLPSTTPEERDGLLSFIIVGGGPTGVEVAADLTDFIRDDVGVLYPKLEKHVTIRLINTGDHLLSTYDVNVSNASLSVFQKTGLEVLKGFRVTEVTADEVKVAKLWSPVVRKLDQEKSAFKYGCIVWCTGIKEHPLTYQLKASLVECNADRTDLDTAAAQANTRGLVTDEKLVVRGSRGSIFALGDAATMQNNRAIERVQELFKAGDVDGSGRLDVNELKQLFRTASKEFPQFEDYASYFDLKSNENENDDIKIALSNLFKRIDQIRKCAGNLIKAPVASKIQRQTFEEIEETYLRVDIDGNTELDYEEFNEFLLAVDSNLRSFPATAQVAAQQGSYLAKLFATGYPDGTRASITEAAKKNGEFTYFHKGALAYLGNGEAAFDVPLIGAITGPLAGLAWKAYETAAQLTWKNRVLVGLDWVRTEIFGRDTSRF